LEGVGEAGRPALKKSCPELVCKAISDDVGDPNMLGKTPLKYIGFAIALRSSGIEPPTISFS
jgi:hypothetical protein